VAQVVVKQLHDVVQEDLSSEATYMADCRLFSFSSHIVRLLTATDDIQADLRRIVMEYVSGILDSAYFLSHQARYIR